MHRFIILLTLTFSSIPAGAFAQTTVRDTGFRRENVVDDTLNRKGRFELSLNVAGAISFGSNSPEVGDSTSESNLYVTASGVVGYMVLDYLELRLSVGLQYIALSAEDDSIARPGFVGTVQALYQKDLVLGLAVYGGVGGGGFYGSRTVSAGAGLEQRYSSVGGIAQALFGLLMMPGPRLLLRGGIRADFLFGSESLNAVAGAMSPTTSFFTTQIMFDVTLGVRFN